jgi:spore maturation protein CgeB
MIHSGPSGKYAFLLRKERLIMSALNIAFFGSSLVSAYWNGAATYYRGLIRALHALGHHVTFYEPDAFLRQQHRDMDDPPWARVVVYSCIGESGVLSALEKASSADVIIKASDVGIFDDLLEEAVLQSRRRQQPVIFWDVDVPATLARLDANPADPLHSLIGQYDLVLTYGGGAPVMEAYRQLGARRCVPIYNAIDPHTHFPVSRDSRYAGDLGFMGNRLPEREARANEFFFKTAELLPSCRFVLGGSGWQDKTLASNVDYAGHVFTREHNAFNCSPRAVLNVSREKTARFGYLPPMRVFEAAGAAACLITDQWDGIEDFFEPGSEILIAGDAAGVATHLESLSPQRIGAIGRAAHRRVLAKHTYAQRAGQVESLLSEMGVLVAEQYA